MNIKGQCGVDILFFSHWRGFEAEDSKICNNYEFGYKKFGVYLIIENHVFIDGLLFDLEII